ncbi:short-chain dehydrogenase [Virgibacillus profundi]|uniref:Short-chain dehydrogenase n=1 Tax=Virgibacillus profundi TaxID=2024555 RepID=A0A2A2IIB2_9BACI|nr:SDR family oxidoreductase [Virgibacillus profundi]PAV30890.1 short-chain dehydrogenase [Virgibacillus profundi]PXY55074.1 KR domain-containing protein [Virgibacillus profundi]
MGKQKTVLVIGGAAGIGKDVVINRANKGDQVVFTDLNNKAGNALVEEIASSGKNVTFLQHDVSSWENTKEIVEKTVNKYGKIDILIHSAGITIQKPFDEITYDTWKKTFSVNLTGLFYAVKAIIPEMLENKRGNIVIIGSGSAITGTGGGVHYAASKGGAFGLMRAIAKKYSHFGIRINIVAPRVIETEMLNQLYPTESSREKLLSKIPVNKIGTLSDTTNAINFLASEESDYIQGQVLLLDGGRTYLT